MSRDELEQFFCGEIGLSLREFWYQMTWRQAINISIGYRKKLRDRYEDDCRIARETYALIYNMFAKNPKSSQELWSLSSDENPQSQIQKEPLSHQEFIDILISAFK